MWMRFTACVLLSVSLDACTEAPAHSLAVKEGNRGFCDTGDLESVVQRFRREGWVSLESLAPTFPASSGRKLAAALSDHLVTLADASSNQAGHWFDGVRAQAENLPDTRVIKSDAFPGEELSSIPLDESERIGIANFITQVEDLLNQLKFPSEPEYRLAVMEYRAEAADPNASFAFRATERRRPWHIDTSSDSFVTVIRVLDGRGPGTWVRGELPSEIFLDATGDPAAKSEAIADLDDSGVHIAGGEQLVILTGARRAEYLAKRYGDGAKEVFAKWSTRSAGTALALPTVHAGARVQSGAAPRAVAIFDFAMAR